MYRAAFLAFLATLLYPAYTHVIFLGVFLSLCALFFLVGRGRPGANIVFSYVFFIGVVALSLTDAKEILQFIIDRFNDFVARQILNRDSWLFEEFLRITPSDPTIDNGAFVSIMARSLLLLMIYFSLRATLVPLAGLMFRRFFSTPRDLLKWLELQRTGAQKYIYIIVMVSFVIVICWLPILNNQGVNLSELANYFWVAPFVIVMELGVNALPDVSVSNFVQKFAEARRSQGVESQIPKVFADMRTHYDSSVLGAMSPSLRDPRGADLDADTFLLSSLGDALEAMDAFEMDERGQAALRIEDGLTPSHFTALCRLLQVRAFDRGEQAWVLCPEHALSEYDAAIGAALAAQGTHFLISSGRFQTRLDVVPTDDLVVGSVEEFEACLERNNDLDRAFERLGMVVVLRTDQADFGLLKIFLSRLRERMKVAQVDDTHVLMVSQFETTRQIQDRFLQIFIGDGGRKKIEDLEPLGIRVDQNAHVLMWRNDEGLREKLATRAPPSAESRRAMAGLMIDIEKRWDGLDLFLLNIDGEIENDYWTSKLPRALQNWAADVGEKIDSTVKLFRHLPIYKIHAPPVSVPVGFVEDRGNLFRAFDTAIRSSDKSDTLLNIVIANYPYGYVFWDALREVCASGTLGDVRGHLRRLAIPIAPDPHGGLVELALLVGAELSAAAAIGEAVPQSRLNRLFSVFEADRNRLRQWDVDANEEGIRRLFMLVQGYVPSLTCERSERHEMFYRIENLVEALRLTAIQKARFRKVGSASDGVIQELPAADFGLTYDEGAQIMLHGAAVQIERVITGDLGAAPELLYQPNSTLKGRELLNVFQRGYSLFGAHLAESQDEFGAPVRNVAFPAVERLEVDGAEEEHGLQEVPRRTSRYRPKTIQLNERVALTFAPRQVMAQRRSLAFWPVPLFEMGPAYLGDQEPQKATGFSREILRSGLLLRLDGALPEPLPDTVDVKRLAFTLATTFQDTLAMLFPNEAPRLAVLSPEAMDLAQYYAEQKSNISAIQDPSLALDSAERFALFRQPFLSCARAEGSQRLLGETDPLMGMVGARYAAQCGDQLGKTAQDFGARGGLHLVLVEDSDHDRGISNAVAKDLVEVESSVLRAWRALLTHTVSAEPASTYYSFGQKSVPDIYDFAGASYVMQPYPDEADTEAEPG